MGWFDDNHWAGEAHDFGRGYMAQSAFSDPYGAPRGHHRAVSTWSARDKAAADYQYYKHRHAPDYYDPDYYLGHRRLTGGGRTATGKFIFGTRKCSVCSVLKAQADFAPEEADESAAKRCCLSCSGAIVQAMRELEAKAQAAPLNLLVLPAPPEQDVEPVPGPVVIGRTHRVFGPDKSSFGMHTCLSCAAQRSARDRGKVAAVTFLDRNSDVPMRLQAECVGVDLVSRCA